MGEIEDYSVNTWALCEALYQGTLNRAKALDEGNWSEVYRISGGIAHIANQLEEFDRTMYLRHKGGESEKQGKPGLGEQPDS